MPTEMPFSIPVSVYWTYRVNKHIDETHLISSFKTVSRSVGGTLACSMFIRFAERRSCISVKSSCPVMVVARTREKWESGSVTAYLHRSIMKLRHVLYRLLTWLCVWSGFSILPCTSAVRSAKQGLAWYRAWHLQGSYARQLCTALWRMPLVRCV